MSGPLELPETGFRDFKESNDEWSSGHEPVGGINRARRDVMDALQNVRLAKNGRKRFEPTGNEVFN